MCKLCNNLDPRSHPATFHDQESTSRSVARLSLRVDPVRLKRSEENCPRCRLVAHALDAHAEGWRKTKPRLLLDLVECAPLRLEVRPDVGRCENIEIFAPFGELVSFFVDLLSGSGMSHVYVLYPASVPSSSQRSVFFLGAFCKRFVSEGHAHSEASMNHRTAF